MNCEHARETSRQLYVRVLNVPRLLRAQAAFADEFATDLGGAILEVVVGSGPCGELRYPAYVEANGWRFPGVWHGGPCPIPHDRSMRFNKSCMPE